MGPPNVTAKDLDRSEILSFILAHERLTKTLRHFGVTKDELRALMREDEDDAEETPPVAEKNEKKPRKASTQESTKETKSKTKKSASKTKKNSEESEKAPKKADPPAEEDDKAESEKSEDSTEASDKQSTKSNKETKSSKASKSKSSRKGSRRSSPRGRRNAVLEPEHYIYQRLLIYSDGAARGNPGESGAGVVLKTPEGEEVGRFGKYLGRKTNNYAEYQAVLLGLHHAREFGASEVTILSDSELLVRQLLGEYRVRAAHLRELFDQVKGLLTLFEKYQVKRIGREKNAEADSMANRAIDEKL